MWSLDSTEQEIFITISWGSTSFHVNKSVCSMELEYNIFETRNTIRNNFVFQTKENTNYNNPRDKKCVCNTNPLLTWTYKNSDLLRYAAMPSSNNTATQAVPFLFTFHQMSRFSYYDQTRSLSPALSHQFIPPHCLNVNWPLTHFNCNTYKSYHITNYVLTTSPIWSKILTICQSENLKQFSKLGNKFIILYYITYEHYVVHGCNIINTQFKYYVQHHR
jgi:hypothetical protein